MVAVSGGVDSGVSASLLMDRGFSVSGLFMRHRYQRTMDLDAGAEALKKWGEKSKLRVFSTAADGTLIQTTWSPDSFPFPIPVDSVSAMELAASIGIDLTIVDADAPFATIVDDFVDRYYSAQTPNPCILCNRVVKFGLLWEVAQKLGADFFATGHYVQKIRVGDWLEEQERKKSLGIVGEGDETEFIDIPEWLRVNPDSCFIARSPTPKDQSYFLYRIKKETLERVIFPVGEFQKPYVREIAERKNLSVARRSDSQEICFVPDQERVNFIRHVRESHPERWKDVPEDTSGPFLSMDGKEIGRHVGYEKYTIGQRKGLGTGFGERIFVQKIIPETRSVVLGPYEALGVREIRAVDANWHAPVPIGEPFRCLIKIRYRNETNPATVRVFPDSTIVAVPDRPCYGVAPGQALVCYWNERLLGGGTIVV